MFLASAAVITDQNQALNMQPKMPDFTITEGDWSETMPGFLTGDFCDECTDLGYCKKYEPVTDLINDKSPYNF